MIISFLNQKGGVGKTTMALNLACCLMEKGFETFLVDADPQGSARDWAEARQSPVPFHIVGMDRPVLHRDLRAMSDGYPFVVVDGPPRATDLTRSAILASDLVIIPVMPSPLDVWASNDVIALIKEASSFVEKQSYAFAINRKVANTTIGREVAKALALYDIPVLDTQITQRVAFAESMNLGQTVLEGAYSTTPAAKEIRDLTSEILEKYYGGIYKPTHSKP